MKLNNLFYTGNAARDAEAHYTKKGTAVSRFTLAYTPRYQRDGEWVDGETCWLDCVLFGDQAERANQTIVKGCTVSIVGQLQQENWEAKDGSKRSKISCRVDKFHIDKGGRELELAGVAAGDAVDAGTADAATDEFYGN